MIEALIGGRLQGKPQQRTGQSGRTYTTAKLITAGTGGDGPVFVSVLAFSETVQHTLLALDAGDSVAIAGTLTVKAYLDRAGLPKPSIDIIAQQVLTAYGAARKRRAVAGEEQPA